LISGNKFLYSQVKFGRFKNESLYHKHHIRSKYIAKARQSIELANHYLYKGTNNTREYLVSMDEGLLFHYRDNCGYSYCTPENTVTDLTARSYGKNLWQIVDRVCNKLFEDGICPMK
jgi:hypothetical protein